MKRQPLSILLVGLLILAVSCQRDEPDPAPRRPSPSPVTEQKFELVGAVTEVDLGDAAPSPSPTPTTRGGRGATPSPTPSASPTATVDVDLEVRLTVQVETMNDPARDLCQIEPGDIVTLIVTAATNVDPVKALGELDDLDDQKISAGGTARLASAIEEEADATQTATASPTGASPTGGTPTPGGGPTATSTPESEEAALCEFRAESLRVVQGEAGGPSPSATPTGSASPTPTSPRETPSPTRS